MWRGFLFFEKVLQTLMFFGSYLLFYGRRCSCTFWYSLYLCTVVCVFCFSGSSFQVLFRAVADYFGIILTLNWGAPVFRGMPGIV